MISFDKTLFKAIKDTEIIDLEFNKPQIKETYFGYLLHEYVPPLIVVGLNSLLVFLIHNLSNYFPPPSVQIYSLFKLIDRTITLIREINSRFTKEALFTY